MIPPTLFISHLFAYCSRVSVTQNLDRDDRATWQKPKRLTRSGCGEGGVRDRPLDSGVASPRPAQVNPSQRGVLTNTEERKVTCSTGTTATENGAVRCGGCGDRVQRGEEGDLATSCFAGPRRDCSTTFSQGRPHTPVPCPVVLEDRRKIASLEQEKRMAIVEVCRENMLIARDYVKSVDLQGSGTGASPTGSILAVDLHGYRLQALPVPVHAFTTTYVRATLNLVERKPTELHHTGFRKTEMENTRVHPLKKRLNKYVAAISEIVETAHFLAWNTWVVGYRIQCSPPCFAYTDNPNPSNVCRLFWFNRVKRPPKVVPPRCLV